MEEWRPRFFCIKSLDTTGFSRVVFQFLPTTTRAFPLDTTGFSRVVFQFLPTTTRAFPLDTTGFSRVVFQFLPRPVAQPHRNHRSRTR